MKEREREGEGEREGGKEGGREGGRGIKRERAKQTESKARLQSAASVFSTTSPVGSSKV